MMSGKLFVDGKDVYKQFGIYVPDGGWTSLIAFPPLKNYEQNDWQEEDGIEVDLSEPVLNTREVSLTFAISGVFSRYNNFIEMLSDGSYHIFNCAVIGRKYKLRLVSQSNREYAVTLGCETLKFADDFPFADYTYKAPSSGMTANDAYLIDGVQTTNYGLRVLQGSFAEVLKTAAVKQNMLRNLKTKSGAIYDGENVFYKAKDVKLMCLMRADTLTELWCNYDALLHDLIQPEERTLTVRELEQDFPFCYKSCQVSEFYPDGRIWLKMTLTVTFTRDFRINEDGTILVCEDGTPVETEDGIYFIDLLLDRYGFDSVRFVNDKQTLRLMSDSSFRFNN